MNVKVLQQMLMVCPKAVFKHRCQQSLAMFLLNETEHHAILECDATTI